MERTTMIYELIEVELEGKVSYFNENEWAIQVQLRRCRLIKGNELLQY